MSISKKNKNTILKAAIRRCKNLTMRNVTIAEKKENVFKLLNSTINSALKGEEVEDKQA